MTEGTEGRVTFGRRMKEARRRKGLTQIELASLTGIGQSELSAIERGRANSTIETLEKIAAAVGEPLHELLRPE